MWRVPKSRLVRKWATTGEFFILVLLFCPGLQAQIYIGGEAGWTGLSGQTDTISGITSPTARFNGGFNTGVRGGYEWGPWRFEEEYSYRQNGARDVVGSNFTVNAAGGHRHSNSIMTNVLSGLRRPRAQNTGCCLTAPGAQRAAAAPAEAPTTPAQ